MAKSIRPFVAAIVLSVIFAVGGCTGLTSSSVSQLSASASSVDFGSVNVGSPTSQLVTVTSKSAMNVTISAVTSGSGFSVNGASGVDLTPGQSVNLYVNFHPAAAGAVTGVLSVASTASPTPLKIALTATGVAQQQHSVALQWSPSSSSVMGYFVYRSTIAGGPFAKLNTSPEVSTSYSDSSVAGGTTYYYAVTSVGPNNVESGYSNPVSVTIPSN
jgi:Abnormal spindle-like microcephaly-assoc'd, ASPM-SPD-2-Hydin